jgi:Fe-S-cluster containining protein
MAKQPWISIDAGTIAPAERPLGWAEALQSPCATCQSAPCCTYLPLYKFRVDTLYHLDHARYLTNFDRIELGVDASGQWSAFYRYPCRFLDRETFRCQIHGKPEQPSICKHYNPYACWYRKNLRTPVSEGFLRIDRPRMEFILAHTVFDDQRNIVEVPSWGSMSEAFAALPCEPQRADDGEVGADPIFDRWQQQIVAPEALARPPERTYAYGELRDPCSGCEAHCCTTLLFPHEAPANAANLDYLAFCLGFPGIELAVSDRGWQLVVKTRCRHLTTDHRCAVHGQPERPLICSYYDANHCEYKPQFGVSRPEDFVRVRLAQFPALVGCFRFDAQGAVTAFPRAEAIRTAIEASWRDAAARG